MGLMVSKAIYMPPSPPRYDFESFKNNLMWIPKTSSGMRHSDRDMTHIPCLFTYVEHARHLIIYCHGNASDLGTLYPEMAFMASTLNAHILCVEYPGYGLHKGDSTEDSLHSTLMDVLFYVTSRMKFDQRHVILYGRSLGTAVCCRVAAELCKFNHPIGGLIMHSPFTNIKEVVEKMVRTAFFVGKVYDSTSHMPHVTCPCLFIHGMKDELVPYEHSKRLFDLSGSARKKMMLFETADHNTFKYYEEVLIPIQQFLKGYCSDAIFGTSSFVSISSSSKKLTVERPISELESLKSPMNQSQQSLPLSSSSSLSLSSSNSTNPKTTLPIEEKISGIDLEYEEITFSNPSSRKQSNRTTTEGLSNNQEPDETIKNAPFVPVVPIAVTYVGAHDPTFIKVSPELFNVPRAMRLFNMEIFERCTPVTIASNFIHVKTEIPPGPFRINTSLEPLFNKEPPPNCSEEERAEHFRVYSRKAVNIYLKSN